MTLRGLSWVHGLPALVAGSLLKPDGVYGCQLWLKIGDSTPVDETGCTLASIDTATP
jgi:hypothetical protein